MVLEAHRIPAFPNLGYERYGRDGRARKFLNNPHSSGGSDEGTEHGQGRQLGITTSIPILGLHRGRVASTERLSITAASSPPAEMTHLKRHTSVTRNRQPTWVDGDTLLLTNHISLSSVETATPHNILISVNVSLMLFPHHHRQIWER